VPGQRRWIGIDRRCQAHEQAAAVGVLAAAADASIPAAAAVADVAAAVVVLGAAAAAFAVAAAGVGCGLEAWVWREARRSRGHAQQLKGVGAPPGAKQNHNHVLRHTRAAAQAKQNNAG
jgi:hypothetical protein